MAIVTIIAAITMPAIVTAAAPAITITIVRLEDIVLRGLTTSERINRGLFFTGMFSLVAWARGEGSRVEYFSVL